MGSVQGMVLSASVVGFILWPKEESGWADRAKELRNDLFLPDTSFFASQAVRNAAVHIDRELDKWATTLGEGTEISPWKLSTADPTDEQKRIHLRYLNVDKTVLWVAGNSCNLFELANEAQDTILPRVRERLPIPRIAFGNGTTVP